MHMCIYIERGVYRYVVIGLLICAFSLVWFMYFLLAYVLVYSSFGLGLFVYSYCSLVYTCFHLLMLIFIRMSC